MIAGNNFPTLVASADTKEINQTVVDVIQQTLDDQLCESYLTQSLGSECYCRLSSFPLSTINIRVNNRVSAVLFNDHKPFC